MKKVRISLGYTVMMASPGDSGREVGWPGEDKEESVWLFLLDSPCTTAAFYSLLWLPCGNAFGSPLLLGFLLKWALPFSFSWGYTEGQCTAHQSAFPVGLH